MHTMIQSKASRIAGALYWIAVVLSVIMFGKSALAQEAAEASQPSLWVAMLPFAAKVLASIGGALVVLWRTRVVQWVKEKIKSETLRTMTFWVNGLVIDVVTAASQTTVRELKKALADGKVSDEEYREGLAKVKAAVVEELLEHVAGPLKEHLGISFGEAKKKIDRKVEAVVPIAKKAVKESSGN